jgi:CTP synthase (UTP-ammonia lyase)
MLGIQDAEHEESAPEASRLLISKLSCSLVGQKERIKLSPGSLTHQLYGQEEVTEAYLCNYGLNPDYQADIGRKTLKVVGVNAEGEVRIVELSAHRFFIATLFMPQLSSQPERPHPLIMAYLKAALNFGHDLLIS